MIEEEKERMREKGWAKVAKSDETSSVSGEHMLHVLSDVALTSIWQPDPSANWIHGDQRAEILLQTSTEVNICVQT